ncbi:MAG TPA: acyl-CoA synthetase FdrA [Chloroflexota bacterium]|nr:acyl-CoA synthetase FdrA [Chloroflexota bacterium]
MGSYRALVRRDTYRDSVELMRVAAQLEQLDGVTRAALLMGTPANRAIMAAAGLLQGDAESAGPNDLVVAVAASDEDAAQAAVVAAERLLASQPAAAATGSGADRPPARTVAEAVAELPSASLAIISTPGAYATAEALKALKRGLHVFLFSDNVPAEDEIELKQLGRQKGLLVMGPDCGTAILDGVPLGFANAVRRGRIGLAGASGTGLQQVTCLIDRLGEGVSQAIGVGGHDLSEAVGGSMMLLGIERLAADPDTNVIVLISKPPAKRVARRVLDAARAARKPVVVNFLGGDPEQVRAAGAIPAATLEDAARLAVEVARRLVPVGAETEAIDDSLRAAVEAAHAGLLPGQRRVHGLYSGGTLCSEAGLILGSLLPRDGFAVIDLGDDEYTVGRPHPMIDFRLRNEYVVASAEDPKTAVILLDVVLGYGSHPDPAGAIAPAIERATRIAADAGRTLTFVASVCGTEGDPQGLEVQEATLRTAGVLLAPSNAQAARLAARVVNGAPGCPDDQSQAPVAAATSGGPA